MSNNVTEKSPSNFGNIQIDLLDRLCKEAEERTLAPQSVDWEEIHRQAAVARGDN